MNCTTCHQPIPAGTAVIRSISFEQVAYHLVCWQLRSAVVSALLPAQRVASEQAERMSA